jgi:phage terminase small subunit
MPEQVEKNEHGLSDAEEMFCQTYIIDFDRAKAVKAMGSKAKRPLQAAFEHLKKPEIQARLDGLIKERIERLKLSQDRVVFELAQIAFSSLEDFASWDNRGLKLKSSSKIDRDKIRVVRSVKYTKKTGNTCEDTIEITRDDRMRALELLGKHLGMWGDGKPASDDKSLIEFVNAITKARAERQQGLN